MLTATDISGLYAIIPTPAVPGAERIDATDTIDRDETARLVTALIDDGASGIIALGTTGECATLRREDYETLVATVIDAAANRVPVVIGATALGSHEVYDRLKFVRQQGADAVMLGMPMWQPLTTEMAVEYYASVSQAFPDLPIMVYANARAFRYHFPVEFWEGVAKRAPTVMSAKMSTPNNLAELRRVTEGRVHFLPIDSAMHKFHEIEPGGTPACWATAASMGPQLSLAMVAAVQSGEQARIDAVAADIAWANEPTMGIITSPEIFQHYNIQLEKTRIEAAGYCRPGPVRPPYSTFPQEYAEASRENGRRWAEMCGKYAVVTAD
jgi:dihydrodipicolinate synthase/N-acetylneuraminate lyase